MGEMIRIHRKPAAATRGIYRAIALLGSAQGLGMICSLIRNKLIAVWVGQSGIALIGILNSAVEMTGALAQQGLRTSAVGPLAAAHGTDRFGRVAAGVASCGLIIGLVSALIMLPLSPWLSRLSFGSGDFTLAFAAMGLAVLLNAIAASRQAIAQGAGRLARLARASLVGSVAGLILSIPVIWIWRIQGLPWIIVIYSAVTTAAYLFPRLRLPHISLQTALTDGRTILRLGVWLTLSSAASWAVSYLFMSWLHGCAGSGEVGLYQSGNTIAVRYLGILFSAIAMEFYPRLSVRAGRSARHPALLIAHETGVILRIAASAAFILILLAPLVLNLLYSPDFKAAAPYLTGALAATPLRALSWCVAFMIIARGDGRVYFLVETMSGLICFFLSAVMYRHAGMAGLGIAYLIWYIIYTAMVLAVCRIRYGLTLPCRTLSWVAATTLLLSATTLIVNFY